jgi:hypothetical protein
LLHHSSLRGSRIIVRAPCLEIVVGREDIDRGLEVLVEEDIVRDLHAVGVLRGIAVDTQPVWNMLVCLDLDDRARAGCARATRTCCRTKRFGAAATRGWTATALASAPISDMMLDAIELI